MNQSLLKVPPAESAVAKPTVLSGINIESLLSKAVDSKAAVEVLKELRAMELDYHARSAKAAFDEAMSAFQAECPVIFKESPIPDGAGRVAYKYSKIEAIEIQIRPLLQAHGFSHKYDTNVDSEPGWVIAKCLVKHKSGHMEPSTVKLPIGEKTRLMNDTKVYGATLTYACRRALQNAYGLIIAGEDTDGGTGKLKPEGPSSLRPGQANLKDLAQELWNTLKSVRGNEQNWKAANEWLWREEILDGAIPEAAPDLSAARFKEVIAKAKELLK